MERIGSFDWFACQFCKNLAGKGGCDASYEIEDLISIDGDTIYCSSFIDVDEEDK